MTSDNVNLTEVITQAMEGVYKLIRDRQAKNAEETLFLAGCKEGASVAATAINQAFVDMLAPEGESTKASPQTDSNPNPQIEEPTSGQPAAPAGEATPSGQQSGGAAPTEAAAPASPVQG